MTILLYSETFQNLADLKSLNGQVNVVTLFQIYTR